MSKRVYTILITQRNNMMKIMTNENAELFKKYKTAVIMNGYDITRFMMCLAFKTKDGRDACAKELRRRGVDCVCRNDGFIDEEYNNGWG